MVRQDLANKFTDVDLGIVPVLDDLDIIVMRYQSNFGDYVDLGGQILEQISQRLLVMTRGYKVINFPADQDFLPAI
jgi:hypothetical protein